MVLVVVDVTMIPYAAYAFGAAHSFSFGNCSLSNGGWTLPLDFGLVIMYLDQIQETWKNLFVVVVIVPMKGSVYI